MEGHAGKEGKRGRCRESRGKKNGLSLWSRPKAVDGRRVDIGKEVGVRQDEGRRVLTGREEDQAVLTGERF